MKLASSEAAFWERKLLVTLPQPQSIPRMSLHGHSWFLEPSISCSLCLLLVACSHRQLASVILTGHLPAYMRGISGTDRSSSIQSSDLLFSVPTTKRQLEGICWIGCRSRLALDGKSPQIRSFNIRAQYHHKVVEERM